MTFFGFIVLKPAPKILFGYRPIESGEFPIREFPYPANLQGSVEI